MGRTVTYWVVTGLLALSALFAGVNYLWGSQQTVQTFANLGYPQQLRVLLGIAKLLGGIALIVPGLPTLGSGLTRGSRSHGLRRRSHTIWLRTAR